MDTQQLTKWLEDQTQERGWSFRQLARRAELSSSAVHGVLNGRNNPGFEFCVGVARAFGVPAEQVLRLAGLLPPLPPPVQEEREAIRILRHLPDAMRGIALSLLRTLAGVAPEEAAYIAERAQQIPRPEPHLSTFEEQLLEQFRCLPQEWQDAALEELETLRQYSRLQPRIIGAEDDQA